MSETGPAASYMKLALHQVWDVRIVFLFLIMIMIQAKDARLNQAELALREGEVPVGCVFVHGPTARIIGRGHNETNEASNATRHAELVAIDSILQTDADLSVLSECDLYVTCEPCIMCAAALREVKIQAVVFGCSNDRFGGCGSVLSVHNGSLPMTGHAYPCQSGLLADEAIALFQQFYSTQNVKAPLPKRRKKDGEQKSPSINEAPSPTPKSSA